MGTIDSLASYCLPPLIQQLRQKYPDLSIRLQPDREAAIIEKVREGEIDIGVILDRKGEDSLLNITTIREEPLVLIASPYHPLSGLEKVELDQLKEMEWIMPEESCNYRTMLEKVLRANGIPFRIGLELGNPEAIKRCVMTGPGISLLPKMVVEEEICRGDLAALPFAHPDIRLDLQMMIHPKKWISHSLLEFMNMLKRSS
ncbi:LysR family transcriptional regulator substrate-binding protein [Paenibacillus sp. P26]|nr:LysR family transcriptional regulator substrate-binding protein [Paenibacillus sp. P26]UUZ97270.1 LysR family transcriptional regulator substrate-binding protein [Paenibacillus sp. P25]